jgi:hypothetical protein
MEPEVDPMEARVDLSPLQPNHSDVLVAKIAARALELRRLRRAVVRRGAVAVVLAAAAGLALWLSAPRRDVVHAAPPTARSGHHDILDLATRTDVDPYELLELGGNNAQ